MKHRESVNNCDNGRDEGFEPTNEASVEVLEWEDDFNQSAQKFESSGKLQAVKLAASMTTSFTKTLHLKIKPNATAWLDKAAIEVNQVWNWANATSAKASRPFAGKPKWLTGFDLCKLSAGATDEFNHIGADTIQLICCEYAQRRRQFKRHKLSWRKSSGSKRSLGWIPFKAVSLKVKGRAVRFGGKSFRVFEPELLQGKLRQGSFSQNALGEWFLNVAVDARHKVSDAAHVAVGIDLGVKSVATTSDGEQLAAGAFYRDLEQRIGQAQCRGHRRQAKRLHRRAANLRNETLHQFSRKLVNKYQQIIIGDVKSQKLVKTRMAKAVLDSGWGQLKAQLQYKGQWAGRDVQIVSERNTTRECSSCGRATGPSGLRDLVVREWACVNCEVTHDRDINAARNILALRYQRPLAGTRLAGLMCLEHIEAA